ncbi:hypothetical protein AVEN_84172-1, partial [Araneus ventricosus]
KSQFIPVIICFKNSRYTTLTEKCYHSKLEIEERERLFRFLNNAEEDIPESLSVFLTSTITPIKGENDDEMSTEISSLYPAQNSLIQFIFDNENVSIDKFGPASPKPIVNAKIR